MVPRIVLALTACAMLAACGNDDNPILMNLRPQGNGPDEFAILPPRPLQLPTDLAALPPPTPGGTNLTDPTPKEDAIIALGGTPQAAGSIPAADAGLVTYASRGGVAPGIRATLAAEDLEFRRDNNGRVLERLFDVNVYFKAYRNQSLDQQAELAFWRSRGARTPSAPPPFDGE
ncbi:MAG: hypothetical protein RLZZ437_1006 [Pseudomonadota bacterium]